MTDLAAVSASEHIYPLGSGVVLFIGRVAVAADADTYTLPTGNIVSVMATIRDTAVTAAAVVSVAWATNVITFHDIAEASTVEIWAICAQR